MKKKTIIAAMLLVGSYSLSAQKELRLDEAVNYALTHKAEAQIAKLDIENSDYLIQEARANVLPQINANGGLTYNPILQQMALNMAGQTMVIKMGQPWQSTATVQLDQQLFNMSAFQGLKAARTTREFYILNNELTEEQIIEKVANSYYEVFKTKSQLTTISSTIDNTTRVRDIISSLFDNGLAKKIDLDRINVALNNLNSNKQQLINAVALQENALKYLIGMDIQTAITLPESTFDINQNMHLDRAIDLGHRTEIKLLEKQGALLKYNKKAIEAQRYPSLAFTANYGYMGLGEQFPYFAGNVPDVSWSNFSAIGLSLRVPLFTGFANKSKISQAQIEIEKYEVELHDHKLALNLQMENAYTQINNSMISLNTQESNLNLAKNVLNDVENNYKNGLATLTDLLDAESSYADAQNNYTNALMDYKVAEVQLVKTKGELKSFYTQPNN